MNILKPTKIQNVWIASDDDSALFYALDTFGSLWEFVGLDEDSPSDTGWVRLTQ